ncbi:AMP-binding enzyme [Zalerion maritima]|uniref:Very long-chain fatty acid transport protein n=1 Tax=Zalerion maritima TaxID=339359 RepID=A0AAD5RKC2_9PEZI|nr:AMP-binding enzyme [Zalerion maritima]
MLPDAEHTSGIGPPPLALAVPAAAAGLAYLNARLSLWYDIMLVSSVVPQTLKSRYREMFDRSNQFYVLEALGTGRNKDRPFILFEDKKYTYGEVYKLALRYGTWLRERRGVKPRDIVAINFMNSDHFVFWLYGLWSIGAKPAFINYNLTDHALVHCVKAASMKLMMVDPEVAHNVSDAVRAEIPDVSIEIFTPELEGEVLASDPKRAPDKDLAESKQSGMAILIYTSGTTGLPKPAIVSWAKCCIAGGFAGGIIGYNKNEVFYTCMPLYHSSATVLGLCNAVEHGGVFAIGRKFSTKTFWRDVRKHKATIIQYVGETCRYLLAAEPQIENGVDMDKEHNVRLAFGNGLRPDVWDKFKERFGIQTVCEFYAATEGSFGTFNVSCNDFSKGAVGRNGNIYNMVMAKEVAVVEVDFATDLPKRNAKGFCETVKPGEPGEMLFNLPAKDIESRFQGYYGNTKATSDKIMCDVFRKGDAWFRTGDVVRWDSEGRMYFSDRIGDTFRWKSENVSTAEVSEAVGHHPAVQEANVYGVQLPHHDGRAGCVALILDGEPSQQTLQSLAHHCRKTLPKYAWPLFLRVLRDSSAHATGTNKQQKHKLRVEGVNPGKINEGDKLYCVSMERDTYLPFGAKEWRELEGGRVKL